MSLNTWHHQGPRKPSSCTTFTLPSHWGRAATGGVGGRGESCVYARRVASVLSNSLQPSKLQPAILLFQRRASPGKSTGVGCHARLQGVFLAQGSNPGLLHLLHWQVGSLPLAPPGKLEIPHASWPKNQNRSNIITNSIKTF